MPKRRKKKKKNILVVILLLLLCIIGVASYFTALKFFGNSNSSDSNKKAPGINNGMIQSSPSDTEEKKNKEQKTEDKNSKEKTDKNKEEKSEENKENTEEKKEDETVKEEKKEEEVKEDQPPEETVKPDSTFAEEAVNNFSVLYPITVNSKRTIDVLNQLIVKDSSFYNETKNQLENYKSNNTTIQFTSFLIQDVSYVGNQQFDIKVSQQLVETKAGNSTTKKQIVVYRVQSSKNSTGIIKATVQ